LKYVVEKLAGLKNVSIENIAEITELNVLELFGK